ncbi:MAG: hypothetical protein K6F82_02885 [Sphaerochaetaceae bacterium]|nr:hypothetical protein [Sphaerochaetaceae bacterium]
MRIEVSGIKGIKDKISFDFENQTISKRIFDKPAIKAIYGTNGSGKTAILTAIDIYINLCLDSFYLLKIDNSASLKKLINKQTNFFEIKVYFITDDAVAYTHRISINARADKPYIEEEEIDRIVGKTINGENEVLLRIKNAECISYRDSETELYKKTDDIVKEAIAKVSEYRSVITLIGDGIFRSKIIKIFNPEGRNKPLDNKTTIAAIFNTRILSLSTYVYLGASDKHKEVTVGSFLEYADALKSKISEPDKVYMSQTEIVVPVGRIDELKEHIQSVYKFIRLFKPTLKGIELIKTQEGEKYRCRMVMVYPEYSVDYEYESAGIKNLIYMYDCLENSSRGGISFIDEMDVNINEIYLERLCSYFMKYGKGQLCITIHNTAPMKILKGGKHSLDFINCSQEAISWIKNGSKSPSNDYKDGMIPGIPFNVNDFDFIEVFGES